MTRAPLVHERWRGARAALAGARARGRLRLRKAKSERDKGAARLFGLATIGLGIGGCVFGAAFGGGFYLQWKGALELVRSGVSVLYVGVMSALVLSSLGHAANAFFTARDLWFWASAPAPAWSRFLDRTTETALAALPATCVLGALALAGLLFGSGASSVVVLRALAALALVAAVPLLLGVTLAHVGGSLLPAGRLRRVSLFVIGVLTVIGLVVLRSARLEQVMTEEGAARFLEDAREVGTVGPAWLPSSYGADFVVTGGVTPLLSLIAWAAALLGVAFLAHRSLHTRARDLADDEAPTGLAPGSLGERALRVVVRLAEPRLRPSLEKDLLAFARDPSQWSQLILLLGIAVLYVVNAKALVLGFESFPEWRGVILGSMHVGLSTFVAAGLSARFAFPQLGLEGPAVWIVEGSPLPAELLLRAKFLATLPVVAGFPTLVGAIGGVALGLPPSLWALTTCLIGAMAVALAGYGLGRGAIAPVFDAVSVSELAMGPGALSTMAVAVVLCGFASFSVLASGDILRGAEGAQGLLAVLPPLVPAGVATLLARSALRRGAAAFLLRRVEGTAGTGAFAPVREEA